MPHPAFIPRGSVFYACGVANGLAGLALLAGLGFDKAGISRQLARKCGGDEAKAADDVAVLGGVELEVRSKGILLVGMGSLLLCAAATSDKKLLTQLAGIIAAGDLALLALWGAAKAADPSFPRLDSERRVAPWALGWKALEAGALGAYLFSCVARK